MSRAELGKPRRSGEEGRRLLAARRAGAAAAEVERIRAGSTWWRRLACLVARHRLWATGLAGLAPDGTTYALVVCRRCGRRFASAVDVKGGAPC